jgi:hypothetical protein
VSGRASRIALLEELVTFMRRSRGVWFTTCVEVARWHRSGAAGAAPRAARTAATGARASRPARAAGSGGRARARR